MGRAGTVLALLLALPACKREREVRVQTVASELCRTATEVDVLHHEAMLRVRLAPASISGDGSLRLRAREAATAIWLDVDQLEVLAVRAGPTALRFELEADRLCIALSQPMAAGEERSLWLYWRANPGARGLHVYPDQIWAGYNTRAWLPTRQDPAQRATLDLKIDVPDGYTAVPSGPKPPDVAELEKREPGSKVWFIWPSEEERRWIHIEHPTPPFLYGFVVGKLARTHVTLPGMSLAAYAPEGVDTLPALEATAAAAQYLFAQLGPPLPRGYTQVFVHGDAAQEAAGFALLSEDSLQDLQRDPNDDWLFTHELAHQWFGWLVPCADFADFWLNEGFATFIVGVVKEQRQGAAAYERVVARWRQRSAQVHAQGRDAPVALSQPDRAFTPPSEAQLQARGVTYFRGALVLHRLRRLLGDDVFWLGVRRYIAERKPAGARTEDLGRALEAESKQDLQPFFERWVYSSAPDV